MKKISIFAVALAMLTWLATPALAQRPDDDPAHTATEYDEDNPPVRLGHCNTDFNPYYTRHFMEQTDQAHEFGAAIYLSPELLKKYAGCTLRSIHFALWDEVGEYYNVFVAEELGDMYHATQPIVQKLVTKGNFHTGWNAVDIPEVTITGDKGLYVGWLSAVTAEHAMEGYFTLDHTRGELVKEGNWYMSATGRWQAVDDKIGLNLMIRAYADGDDHAPAFDVGLSNLNGPDVIWQDQSTAYSMLITNYGIEPVLQMDVDVLSDGKLFDQKHLEGLTIGHNEHMTLTVDNIQFPDAGNHSISVEVKRVDGYPDSDENDNEVSMQLYSIPANTEPVPRTILMEEMTSELDPLAPVADSLYREAVQACDDVIWIKHHIDGVGTRRDGNPWDTFATDEDREYIRFYEGFPQANCDFTPALVFDRNHFNNMAEQTGICYFIADDWEASMMFEVCRQVPCYLSIEAETSYEVQSSQLQIDVEATSAINQLIYETDLRLTIYVVEDSLRSVLQKTNKESLGQLNDDGTYTQNGVIRSFVTGVWGEQVKLLPVGSMFGFDRHYTVSIPEDWNVDNLRVVAFAHNYDEEAQYGNNVVYNAAQSFVRQPAGLADIEHDDANIEEAISGRVPSGNGTRISTIEGQTIPAGTQLKPGFYIVRRGDDSARKVLIRKQ